MSEVLSAQHKPPNGQTAPIDAFSAHVSQELDTAAATPPRDNDAPALAPPKPVYPKPEKTASGLPISTKHGLQAPIKNGGMATPVFARREHEDSPLETRLREVDGETNKNSRTSYFVKRARHWPSSDHEAKNREDRAVWEKDDVYAPFTGVHGNGEPFGPSFERPRLIDPLSSHHDGRLKPEYPGQLANVEWAKRFASRPHVIEDYGKYTFVSPESSIGSATGKRLATPAAKQAETFQPVAESQLEQMAQEEGPQEQRKKMSESGSQQQAEQRDEVPAAQIENSQRVRFLSPLNQPYRANPKFESTEERRQRLNLSPVDAYELGYSISWGRFLTDAEKQKHLVKLSVRKEARRILLKSPRLILFLRLIVWTFAILGLGVAGSILRFYDVTPGYQPSASVVISIVINAVAVVYLIFITLDEYIGKPIGLRPARSKLSLILCDLFFICFQAANLSLQFEAVTDNGSCSRAESGVSADPCPDNYDAVIQQLPSQRALASLILISLIIWLITFSICVLRVVIHASGEPINDDDD